MFDTAIGSCGIAWSDAGITAVQLPAQGLSTTRARLLDGAPSARETIPPPAIRKAIESIIGLLAGNETELRDAPLDLTGVSEFDRSVYSAAMKVPAGSTATYGAIARNIGRASAARAVGGALGRNPVPLLIPCHRVLAASGKPCGFSAPGGIATKLRLLAIESAAAR
jgi:methylated-DNA-[protein]-cysteine S-methyltransferase